MRTRSATCRRWPTSRATALFLAGLVALCACSRTTPSAGATPTDQTVATVAVDETAPATVPPSTAPPTTAPPTTAPPTTAPPTTAPPTTAPPTTAPPTTAPPTTAPPTTAPPTTAPPTTAPAPTVAYLDIFRAEGGATYRNTETGLPARRVDASYDNSYRDCPDGDCIRGRVQAATVAGPFTIAERLEASALVYNTFKAQTADAELEMDVAWVGKLFSVIAADASASVAVAVNVAEIDSAGNLVKTVAGMPYTVMEHEIGSGLQGVDTIDLQDSRSITVPMRLVAGQTYRVELELTCSTRASFSASSTGCSFSGDGSYAEWTAMRIAFFP